MSERNYPQIVAAYEDDVLSGRVPACKWVRLACARNARDTERWRANDAGFPYYFDAKAGTTVCGFAELLPHIKGPKAKVVGHDDDGLAIWATIQLEPWQVWLLMVIFGWKRRDTHKRRFRTALVMVPRKNAKSTLGAVVVLYMLTADGEGGPNCYSAATTRDQAKVIAEIAWEMAKRSHGFRAFYGVKVGAQTNLTLTVPATAGSFAPLSADAHSLDGLNVSLATVDELHAHKTSAVWDVLITATGARDQPLILATTTAGGDLIGVCHKVMEHAQHVLERDVDDETFFGIIYTIDDGDDWLKESSWRKANPNYGVSVDPEDLRSKAIRALTTPEESSSFKTKHLNVWVHSLDACLSVEGWRAGQTQLPTAEARAAWRDELLRERCYIGIDLASKKDLCALSLVFPPTETRPRWRLIQHIWTPEETLVDRSRRDRAPYDIWVAQGWLQTTPGSRIDHAMVRQAILDARGRYNIELVGFDPWHADQLINQLITQDGFSDKQVLEVAQTYQGMSSACLHMQAEILGGKVDAGGCPVTAWAVSNAVANQDGKENLVFAKRKSRGRIDPLIAATIGMALWWRVRDKPAEPKFQILVL